MKIGEKTAFSGVAAALGTAECAAMQTVHWASVPSE